MGDTELEKFAEGLVKFFGDNLANPDREPNRFKFQVKFYKYITRPQANVNSQKE